MNKALLVLPLAGLLAAACGGSSSETPWPVEPEVQVQGPVGEVAPPDPSDIRTDAGAPKKQE